MKATDLMIGDLCIVKSINKVGVVKEMYSKSAYVWCGETYSSIYVNRYAYNDIEPIPLTPEILEKNGWWQDEIDGTYHNTISVYGRKAPFSILDGVVINYVHQLQHALRLCGLDNLADNFKI